MRKSKVKIPYEKKKNKSAITMDTKLLDIFNKYL